MKWSSFFDAIYLINLSKREDRLLQTTEDFEKYDIPFERIQAIEKDNGAEGLRETIEQIFANSLEQGHENILVFEDDCEIVVAPELFTETMSNVVKQLPERYVMVFLGCQITGNVTHFVSPNIISANKMFSTHAVIYSERGMREIIASQLESPIDNHYVAKIEPLSGSYCVYPLLCSQREGYSDIGKANINWHAFIVPRFEQRINEMRAR